MKTPRLAHPWVLRPIAFAIASALWGTAPAYAADAPSTDANTPPLASLPAVTVSASGLQLGGSDMATPVTVLEGDELVRLREGNLGESLASQPGIHSSHFGAGASRPVIRGVDGPRVKILSDGAEVQDASTVSPDHAVVSEPLLARQIEVLRGPSALLYGAGAVGGAVNVLDEKVPTTVPSKGYEGSAELRGNTAASERTGAFGITGGAGPLALRVEGATRNAGDYRVGSGWAHEGEPHRRVEGSFNRTDTGTVGLSWVGSAGYLGAAYTRHTARYGLPGHAHDLEGCHTHGSRLHCGAHGGLAPDEEAHDEAHGDVPVVDLRSDRLDIRGEWRQPFAGVAAMRLRAGLTDYTHDEIEDGAVGTTFSNRAHDTRLELQHLPIAGWRGVLGLQTSQRKFKAEGDEAYIEPTRTRKLGLFALEEYRLGPWRIEAALRHDRQTTNALDSNLERSHNGTSASLGAVWQYQTGYSLGASVTRASRAPTAEELYANGLHLATRTIERGNPNLRAETSNNLDISWRKTAGDTTWELSAFRNRVNHYIYANTLDALEGIQLVEYTQARATFTGLEGQLRQRLGNHAGVQWAATVFGDTVRARLDGGARLPRISPARAGVRLEGSQGPWQGQVEWVHTARQSRVAAFEEPTSGFGMLHLALAYQGQTRGQPWQVYIKGSNLTNRLAYAHTSYIKNDAPLVGRNITVGVKVAF
jgi:iron complex outermembrane receptor protein